MIDELKPSEVSVGESATVVAGAMDEAAVDFQGCPFNASGYNHLQSSICVLF